MLTIAGNVVKYLRYWKTALKNRAFRCCFQREGDGESPSANLSAASLERPRESAAGASRYRSAEICVGIIRVVPRLTSPLSQGRGFYFMDKACPCRALHDKGRWHLRQQMTEGICCGFQSAPKFAAFESPQALWASVPTPFGPSGHFPLIGGIGPLCPRGAGYIQIFLSCSKYQIFFKTLLTNGGYMDIL